MGEVESLDSLMGPTVKGGYPGPTLAELILNGFARLGLFAIKRDGDNKVIEIYQRVEGQEYYSISSVKAYDDYFNSVASRLKKQLNKTEISA